MPDFLVLPPPDAYRRAAARIRRWLSACVLCPRGCQVNRLEGEKGFCRAAGGTATVNLAQLHHGEEPPISGLRGSGTVFFAGCTLACLYCQNYMISQEGRGEEFPVEDLAAAFLELQILGAHNLNLVTPTPHLAVILEALALARENGCHLPVVYNTSGYERASVIKQLDGLVEIYMPDYKYFRPESAARLSDGENYPHNCRRALVEMHRQVGPLKIDEHGVAKEGVLVRHLVLPEGLASSTQVLEDLRRIGGQEVCVSLMAQYHPMYKASDNPPLDRRLTAKEYREAQEAMKTAGITRGFVQSLASSNGEFIPGWNL